MLKVGSVIQAQKLIMKKMVVQTVEEEEDEAVACTIKVEEAISFIIGFLNCCKYSKHLELILE